MAVPTPTPAEQFSAAAQALLNQFLGSAGQPDLSQGTDATKVAALQARVFGQHAALWQSMLASKPGGPAAAGVAPAERSDRRFSSAEWRRDPWFDYLRQS